MTHFLNGHGGAEQNPLSSKNGCEESIRCFDFTVFCWISILDLDQFLDLIVHSCVAHACRTSLHVLKGPKTKLGVLSVTNLGEEVMPFVTSRTVCV